MAPAAGGVLGWLVVGGFEKEVHWGSVTLILALAGGHSVDGFCWGRGLDE